MSRRLLAFRVQVAAVLAAACFLEAYHLVLRWTAIVSTAGLDGWLWPVYHAANALVVVCGTLLALALLWRAEDQRYARALATFVALITYTATSDANYRFRTRMGMPEWASVLLDSTIPVALLLAVAALAWFSGLFPRALPEASVRASWLLPRTRAWFLRGGFRWGAAMSLFAVAECVYLAKYLGGGAETVAEAAFTLLKPLLILFVLVGFTVAAANLHTGYAMASEVDRRRLFWILEGVLAGTVLMVLTSAAKVLQMALGATLPLQYWYELSLMVALLVMIACLAIAVFFAGAIDPGLTVRRTAVVGAVGVAMVFVFAGVEQLIQEQVAGWLGLSDRAGGMLTGGTVALTFDPIRRAVDRAVTGVSRRWALEPAVPAAADVVETVVAVAP